MNLNGVIAFTLRYFAEFGKHMNNNGVDLWRNLRASILYCRRKEVHVRYLISL